jgi:hypothetical protein
MFEAYVASGARAQLQVLPPFGVEGHAEVAVGPVELWWPSVESFLSGLHLPTSMMVELPALASIPAPNPLNAACTMHFNYYVVARAHRSPFYFAWGCFRDFVSGPCGAPPIACRRRALRRIGSIPR